MTPDTEHARDLGAPPTPRPWWRVVIVLLIVAYGLWSGLEWAVTDDQRTRLDALGNAATMAALLSVFLPQTWRVPRWLDALLLPLASMLLLWVTVQRWRFGSWPLAVVCLLLFVGAVGAFVARRSIRERVSRGAP